MPSISMKVTGARTVNIALTKRAITKSVKKQADEIEKKFREISDNFKNHDVNYTQEVSDGGYTRTISTDADIMNWLNNGTSIRWALMSNDWSSKTRPNSTNVGAGSGRAVLRGQSAMQAKGMGARPGIEARNFDEAIQKESVSGFVNSMRNTMRAISISFWR